MIFPFSFLKSIYGNTFRFWKKKYVKMCRTVLHDRVWGSFTYEVRAEAEERVSVIATIYLYVAEWGWRNCRQTSI